MIFVNSLFTQRPNFSMGFVHFFLHAVNFALPALGVALLLASVAAGWQRRSPRGISWRAQVGIQFCVGMAVLGGGLIVFGVDGKMLTYVALVVACGTAQWLMAKGWVQTGPRGR